jgi:hypothetical protein
VSESQLGYINVTRIWPEDSHHPVCNGAPEVVARFDCDVGPVSMRCALARRGADHFVWLPRVNKVHGAPQLKLAAGARDQLTRLAVAAFEGL